MDINYYSSFIAVADDCPVTESVVPTVKGDKKTAAVIQYEMIAGDPYRHTQEDVLFNSWLQRQALGDPSADEVARLREEFFAKDQPCLRASPLPKKFGWGLVFDDKGGVALCPMESEEYKQRLEDGDLKVMKAMRSKRA